MVLLLVYRTEAIVKWADIEVRKTLQGSVFESCTTAHLKILLGALSCACMVLWIASTSVFVSIIWQFVMAACIRSLHCFIVYFQHCLPIYGIWSACFHKISWWFILHQLGHTATHTPGIHHSNASCRHSAGNEKTVMSKYPILLWQGFTLHTCGMWYSAFYVAHLIGVLHRKSQIELSLWTLLGTQFIKRLKILSKKPWDLLVEQSPKTAWQEVEQLSIACFVNHWSLHAEESMRRNQ